MKCNSYLLDLKFAEVHINCCSIHVRIEDKVILGCDAVIMGY